MGGEEEGIGKWGRIPQHIDHRGPVRKMNMNSAFVLYRITYLCLGLNCRWMERRANKE